MSKKYERDIGLYVHIPWCIRKCDYCAFNSFPNNRIRDEYMDALISEARWGSELLNTFDRPLASLYFGGGTPSLLEPLQLERLIKGLPYFLQQDCEITLEINPVTNERNKLKAFRTCGINRLSIGVQSFDEDNLKFLGRLHSPSDSEKTFVDARRAGFDNISIDIIFALPGQRGNALLKDLEKVTALGPEHISLYLLTVEEETPMGKGVEEGEIIPASDFVQEELFLLATDFLKEMGYDRYETSNFAKKGYHSRHNMRYWQGVDYIGIGAGAHSFLSEPGWGMRWWNKDNPDDYENCLKKGEMPLESLELLSREEAVRETVMIALRTEEGLKESFLKERYGLFLHEAISKEKLRNIPDEFYVATKGSLVLTHKGALLADDIAERITL